MQRIQCRAVWRCAASLVGFLCLAVATAQGQESWDAVYMGNAKIGWVHTFVEKVSDRGRPLLRVRIDMEQTTKRGNDFAVAKVMYGTIETLEGRVLRLDTLTSVSAGTRIQAHGDVIDGKMDLKLETPGGKQVVTIPWGPEVRGPYAAEQSMARKPMKPGETRKLRTFIPDLNKICDLTLVAHKVEPTVLGDGSSRALLKVEHQFELDGVRKPEFELTSWSDEAGQILKSEQDLMGGIITYRTTKEAAKSPAGPIQFDLIRNTLIKVRDIQNPEQTRRVTYRLKLKNGDLARVFPNDARQKLDLSDKITGTLVVESRTPVDGEAVPGEVAAEFIRSNALITSDDEVIQRAAARITRAAADPWGKVERITHWVYQSIRDKNFETAFAPASEVIQSLAGDCTEHSVLAAALLRAAGIPTRVVVGLVYFQDQRLRVKGFGFHMWDEVHVNQRWVAIDPTFDQTTVDGVHIKLSESSLAGVAPFEMFVPIMSVAGKLEIEPVDVR